MRDILDVDPAAAAPIWRQIEDGVRRLVASGVLTSDEAVPSVRELARSLRVNPATVSKAYRRLTESGLLTVRRGEGTFVSDLSPEEREAQRRRLLDDGATAYIRVATSIGADRESAVDALRLRWPEKGDRAGKGSKNE